MKFYKYNHQIDPYVKIINNKLTSVFISFHKTTMFFKNGKYHNNKNAAIYYIDGIKEFRLNSEYYGNHKSFTKESWRKSFKLQVFL
jgi:hypothetical protein